MKYILIQQASVTTPSKTFYVQYYIQHAILAVRFDDYNNGVGGREGGTEGRRDGGIGRKGGGRQGG